MNRRKAIKYLESKGYINSEIGLLTDREEEMVIKLINGDVKCLK